MPKLDISLAGEINLDLILYGLPEDLPTERELLAEGSRLTLGSSSAICAHNLAVLGAQVGFVTRVGSDPLGHVALERLREAGVDLSHVVHATGPTTTGLTVILPHAHARHIVTYPGTMFEMSFADLDLAYLSSARHFHMSSLFLHRGLADRIPELFQAMKKAGLSTSLDTNDDPDDRWQGALRETLKCVDVFMPNAREAKKIAGTGDLEAAIASLAARVPTLVVKMGAGGAMAQRGGKRVTAPALQVAAVDPVGAGDSFDAGFIFQHVRSNAYATSLAFGNLMGAFSTTRPGGTEAFRDQKYLDDFLNRHWALRVEENHESAESS